MSIEIKEIRSLEDNKLFVDFMYKLYKDNKYWVPPIIKDELEYLNPKYNPAFKFSDVNFFVALKNNEVVGRIGAIINHEYNEKAGKKYIRFVKPEFIDNAEVVDALINKVIEIGKANNMTHIHGPLGFTNLDTQGLLVEGFEELQSIASVYHLPYYRTHFERLGFLKENDWLEFQLNVTEHAFKKADRGSKLIQRRFGFEVVSYNNINTMIKDADFVFEILNEAFEKLPYVIPINDELKKYYVKKYFKVLNPKYVKAVKKDNELIGFQIAVPSMSKAMQKANGKLSLPAIWSLLKARKKNNLADLFLTGVKEKYQKNGVAVILFSEIQNALHNNGMDVFETTGVFETNSEVISNWKNYDSRQHKRRRCYVKEII